MTFGAAGRIERAHQAYEAVLEEARARAVEVEMKRAEARIVLDELVTVKTESLSSLRRIQRIAKNLTARNRKYMPEVAGEEPPSISIKRIEHTLGAASTAKSAATGLAAGASTAMGAWALVGVYGAASTGTALASLSGAAASSATL